MHLFFIFIVILFSCLVSACSGSPAPESKPETTAYNKRMPDDAAVYRAVQGYFESTDAPRFSAFDYNRKDLNHDGLLDAVVYLSSPYSHWCTTKGCSMLVLEAQDEKSLKAMPVVSPVRKPLYISNQTSRGWNIIVAKEDGYKVDTRYVRLAHNGRTYPSDPHKAPAATDSEIRDSIRVFP